MPRQHPSTRTWLGIRRLFAAGLLSFACLAVADNPTRADQPEQDVMQERLRNHQADRLIDEIEQDVRDTSLYLGTDQLDPRVITAIRQVPREQFVPPSLAHQAYANRPLPIGGGQTISQPYIVAIMSHLLHLPADGGRVFELGTGSGYQAAVLAAMGAEVYSKEIIPDLAAQAAGRLEQLGLERVHIQAGDGYLGWPEAAPFDAIIVTAAGPEVPQPLVEQLKIGGRLVMPLGPIHQTQDLVVLTKQRDGRLGQRQILPVRFVPITGSGVTD